MKKLAFLFLGVVALSFASCGNNTQATEEETDTVVVETEECEIDTTAVCDTLAGDTL